MMMKVRVASESFGSGKPNIVYSSCQERMTAAIARAIQRGVFNKTRLEGQAWYDETIHRQRERVIQRKEGIEMANKKLTNLANTNGNERGNAEEAE